MRRAMDSGFLLEGDKLVALNLGADFCAEHEWGIKRLKSHLGIEPETVVDKVKRGVTIDKFGIDLRMVTKVPEDSLYFHDEKDKRKKKQLTCLAFGNEIRFRRSYDKEKSESTIYEMLNKPYDDKVACAWDEATFSACASKPEERGYIRELYEALKSMDFAVWLGGGGVFQNAGLVLAIKSRIPEDKLKSLYEGDQEQHRLYSAAYQTGIHQILEKAGKRYYALSPRWEKGEIVFWLNPMEQQKHNYGWYTLADLKQWAEDKGPIMMGPK